MRSKLGSSRLFLLHLMALGQANCEVFSINLERSSKSRGEVYRTGDMYKQEVIQYLDKKGIDKDLFDQCYELCAGRINHLKKLTSNLIDKRLPFDGVVP